MRLWPAILLLCIAFTSLRGQVYETRALNFPEIEWGEEFFSLYQDSTGLIWAGCSSGLWQRDNRRSQKLLLPNNELGGISALVRKGDTLFAGTLSGVLLFSAKQAGGWSPLRRLPSEEGYPAKPINALCLDANQRLWMGVSGEGLYLRQAERWYLNSVKEGLPSLQINGLISDGEGGVLAATDRGLVQVQQVGSQRAIQRIRREGDNDDELMTALTSDGNGGAWLGFFSGGLGYWAIGDSLCRSVNGPLPWTYGPVVGIAECADRIWVLSESGALYEMDPGTGHVRPLSWLGRGPERSMQRLISTREGSLLMATRKQQLLSMDPRCSPLLENDPAIAETQAVLKRRDGSIWFSTLHGLYRFDPRSDQFAEHIIPNGMNKDAVVVSLFESSDSSLWIGTFDYGAFRMEAGSDRAVAVQSGQDQDPQSVLVIEESNGLIWLGTLGGVYAALPRGEKAHFLHLGIGKNYVYSIYSDPLDGIWFGTDGAGAWYLNTDSLQEEAGRVNPSSSYLLDAVLQAELRATPMLQRLTDYRILRDAKERLWIHTREAGLYAGAQRSHRGVFQNAVPVMDRRSGEEIMSIGLDSRGVLLLLHEHSIHWLEEPGYLSRALDLSRMRDRPRPMSNAVHFDGSELIFGSNNGPYSLKGSISAIQVNPLLSIIKASASGLDLEPGARTRGGGSRWSSCFQLPGSPPMIKSFMNINFRVLMSQPGAAPWMSALPSAISSPGLIPSGSELVWANRRKPVWNCPFPL